MSQGRYVSGELVSTVYVVNMTSGGGGGAVDSVFGRTGAVTAASGDYEVFYLKKDTDGQTQTISGNGLIVTDGPLTVTGDLTVGSDILPVVSGSSNLGSAALPFGSGYFSSGSVFIGDSHLTSTGNDLYVNGQVVYQSVETLSDFALNPGTFPYWATKTGSSTPAAGEWFANGTNVMRANPVDSNGTDWSTEMTALSTTGTFWYSIDSISWTETTNAGGFDNLPTWFQFNLAPFNVNTHTSGIYISFSDPATAPGTPLQDGDIIQYVSSESKFKPTQGTGLRSALGIGEYVDDAAAGTGGLTTGELYYNTTSSSYVLKA